MNRSCFGTHTHTHTLKEDIMNLKGSMEGAEKGKSG